MLIRAPSQKQRLRVTKEPEEDCSLGTQLRHLVELLDGAVERNYAGMGYRPRYTPVMRCLIADAPMALGVVARCAGITQPAATQTVALMIEDGLIRTAASEDGRRKLLELTERGRAIVPQLHKAWAATARAAAGLDDELPFPLSSLLAAAIEALESKSFDQRIAEAEARTSPQGNSN